MEWLYGADAGSIHANGLFDWYKLQRIKGDSHNTPENQWDLVQAYLDVAVPVGNGLRLRAGKSVTPLGYETISPIGMPFYSHSYLFGFAIPFTHTGVMGAYQVDDNWGVEAGVFRGWDQALEDNNDNPSYHAKANWTSTDKKYSITGQFVTGPEQPDDNGDYRTVIDLIGTWQATEKLSFAINGDYGWESEAAADEGNAQWYGVAGYAAYKLNDMWTLNGRGEWFRDNDGARTGFAANYYEVTLGVSIRPMPKDHWGKNVLIRPEIRGDWSDERVFNGGDDYAQYTVGVDVIVTF